MEVSKIKILYIVDDKTSQQDFKQLIESKKLPYDCTFINSFTESRGILNIEQFDVVITCSSINNDNIYDILDLKLELPIIIISDERSIENVIKAMKAGASDFLVKDTEKKYLEDIPLSIENAIEKKQTENELQKIKNKLEMHVEQRTAELANAYYELLMKLNESQTSEEKYRKYEFIVNNSKEFMTLINRSYVYETVNDSYVESFRKKREDIIGEHVSDIWGKEQFENVIKGYMDKCFAGEEIHYQQWFSLAGSEKRYFDVSYYPYRNQIGKVSHIVIVTRNVTQQKQMENQLLHSERLAAIGEFSASLAHEIRNPITIIKSTAQFCQSNYESLSKEKIKKMMAIFTETSDRINKIIHDLLTFSKPQTVSLEEGDIIIILKKACSFLEKKFASQKVKLNTDFPDKLPSVMLDEDQIYGVFLNLMLNSLEAMQEGGELNVNTKIINKEIEIIISDTGSGISEENLKKIFNPFFTTKEKGTGLGLSLVHQVINSHQGNIKINSIIGKGTQVVMHFPLISGNFGNKQL